MLNFVFALILQPELHQTADILVQRGILAQKARFRSKVDTEAVTDPHGNSCLHPAVVRLVLLNVISMVEASEREVNKREKETES